MPFALICTGLSTGGIDTQHRIIVSKSIIEEDRNHPYGVKQLEGKRIHLPAAEKYYPIQENLEWHRENVFKG
ncbi:hypothetical protein ACFSAH_03620 [Pseudopedobacter beijingensis]|uniref:Uncharacterized protein n=1 Tax=Pseudopedobacter beijingensis TaxID=1207056 RepID=A0ABW4I9H0_9SPHI